MDENKSQTEIDDTEDIDELLENYHQMISNQPESSTQTQTPFCSSSNVIPVEPSIPIQTPNTPVETSVSQQISENPLNVYEANFEAHVQHSWDYISRMSDAGSSNKRKSPYFQIPEFPNKRVRLNVNEIPRPICSCTGARIECIKYGIGGWQSTCCTTNISQFPLPFDPRHPNTRIKGRRITPDRFGRILERLESDGYDFNEAIDLKAFWIAGKTPPSFTSIQ